MIPYPTKIKKLPGTSYAEVRKEALILFVRIPSVVYTFNHF